MDEMYNNMADGLTGLEKDIVKIIETVKALPFGDYSEGSMSGVATTAKVFATSLESIALTLLIFFFFYEFLKKTVMFEFVNWENVVKILLRFFIAKLVVQNCYAILEVIAIVMNGVLGLIGDPKNIKSILSPEEHAKLAGEYAKAGFWDGPFVFLKMAIAWFIVLIIRVVVVFVVIGRFLEIAIYTAIAPIPLSTIAGESTSSIAISFIKGYIAVLLQGVIIVAMCCLYVSMAQAFGGTTFTGMFGNLITYLICSAVLLFTVLKSGNWAKQIMGA